MACLTSDLAQHKRGRDLGSVMTSPLPSHQLFSKKITDPPTRFPL